MGPTAVATCKVAPERLRPTTARVGGAPHIVVTNSSFYVLWRRKPRHSSFVAGVGGGEGEGGGGWGAGFLEIQLFSGRYSEPG